MAAAVLERLPPLGAEPPTVTLKLKVTALPGAMFPRFQVIWDPFTEPPEETPATPVEEGTSSVTTACWAGPPENVTTNV